MPKYQITAPDGSTYEVNAPEGATEQQAIEYVQTNLYKQKPEVQPINFDPTDGMSTTDKLLAGAGKAFADIGRGVGQMVGAVSDKEVNDAKRRDAALMNTGAGTVGNVVGNAAAIAPALFIPGANTYAGATLVGGVSGALQPVGEGESRLENIGYGAAGGAAGQGAGNLISKAIGKNVANAAAQQALNATKDATLETAQKAGYQVPKSLTNPSFISNRLESLAGKAATKQAAAANNQQVTNNLARQYLGLAPDTPLDKASMEILRDTYAEPYRIAASLPAPSNAFTGVGVANPTKKSGAQLVDAIKEARDASRAAWRSFNTGMAQSPTKVRKEAIKADRMVAKLENELEALAQQNNMPDLVNELRNARVNIAKVHSVENALNEATGDVSARTLMAQGKRSKLTGEAKTIADFAKAFPQVAQDGVKNPAAGVSKMEMGLASILGGIGGASAGFPGIAAAAIPFSSHLARPLAVNGGMPVYGSSVARAASKQLPIINNSVSDLLPYFGLLGGAGTAAQF